MSNSFFTFSSVRRRALAKMSRNSEVLAVWNPAELREMVICESRRMPSALPKAAIRSRRDMANSWLPFSLDNCCTALKEMHYEKSHVWKLSNVSHTCALPYLLLLYSLPCRTVLLEGRPKTLWWWTIKTFGQYPPSHLLPLAQVCFNLKVMIALCQMHICWHTFD